MIHDSAPGRSRHLTRVAHAVSTTERERQSDHLGGALWLTGLSGSRKSTLAFPLEAELLARGYQLYVPDGDNTRHGLDADLGFTHDGRTENIRRSARWLRCSPTRAWSGSRRSFALSSRAGDGAPGRERSVSRDVPRREPAGGCSGRTRRLAAGRVDGACLDRRGSPASAAESPQRPNRSIPRRGRLARAHRRA